MKYPKINLVIIEKRRYYKYQVWSNSIFGCLLTSHFHPKMDDYCTGAIIIHFWMIIVHFSIIVKNLCNNHPKMDDY